VTSKKKRYAQPVPAAPVKPAGPTRRDWTIRSVAVLAIAVGAAMTLIGATPDIAGGWGRLVLMVPGMLIATAGLVAFVETTSMARSRRGTRRRMIR
jgi:peptidoglycan/LPS O-acetylase OafA/YrhL